jgi:hypothetical protein
MRSSQSDKLANKKRKKIDSSFDSIFSDDEDLLSEIDCGDFKAGESEEDYWGRKLGLYGEGKDRNKLKLAEEYAKDGLGDDFLELFDFMDDITQEDNPASVAADLTVGPYIPPHRRSSTVEAPNPCRTHSMKGVSFLGLLNRVSEGNIDSISRDILSLVGQKLVDADDVASGLVKMACENPHISNTLQGTFAGIACAIAVETAPSVRYSGSVLAKIVSSLTSAVLVETEHRRVTNLIRFSSFLFSLGLVPVDVVESLLKFLAQDPRVPAERRTEWILMCLRLAGRVLKDHHKSRMSILLNFLTTTLQNLNLGGKKMEFALKELSSMKEGRSNFRAIDHLQSIAEWLSVRTSTSKKFKALSEGSTLNGWRVPTPVQAAQLVVPNASNMFSPSYSSPKEWTKSSNTTTAEQDPQAGNFAKGPSLEELASMNRMNSEIKKNAFVAIMGAVDSKHAIMRLDEYGLLNTKPKNCSSVVAVVVHCALQEKKVNKFYFDLIKGLCVDQRDSKVCRKFSISFKIEFSKLISSGKLDQTEVGVLSSLIAYYIQVSNGAVSMGDFLKPPSQKEERD